MSKQLAIANTLPTGSIDAYISAAYQLPMLSAEEERSLAVRLQEEGDLEAARTLVMSHLRFVIRIARGYAGYGLALPDLIQEGTVGLMKAVRRFDPDHGVRLVSFAVHWIKAEIHEYVLRNWRIVKVATTKAQRKLFFNLRSAKKRLGWMNPAEVEAVAADLNVKPETVLEMEDRLSGHDVSFSAVPQGGESEDEAFGPEQYLAADESYDPVHRLSEDEHGLHQFGRLQSALRMLDTRSRDILQRRWLDENQKTGLKELADEYGVSAERIRQIESAALKKLRTSLTA
jgi:RNA polymerase sigma-32 factor